jgi:hypothetical protein
MRGVRSNTRDAGLAELLYYRGAPTTSGSSGTGAHRAGCRARDGTDAALPDWARAVTNIFGVKIDGICAILDQSNPAQEGCWLGRRRADRAAVEVINNAMPVLRDEIAWDTLRSKIHKQIVLTDKVALCLYYDNDEKHGTVPIGAEQCTSCGAVHLPMTLQDAGDQCPECGGTDFTPALDPANGMALGWTLKRLWRSSSRASAPPPPRASRAKTGAGSAPHAREDKHQVLRWWPSSGHPANFEPTAPAAAAALRGQYVEDAPALHLRGNRAWQRRWGWSHRLPPTTTRRTKRTATPRRPFPRRHQRHHHRAGTALRQ